MLGLSENSDNAMKQDLHWQGTKLADIYTKPWFTQDARSYGKSVLEIIAIRIRANVTALTMSKPPCYIILRCKMFLENFTSL